MIRFFSTAGLMIADEGNCNLLQFKLYSPRFFVETPTGLISTDKRYKSAAKIMCAVSYERIMSSLPFGHPPGFIALRFLSAH
jgi:hypothetical protein